MKTLVCLFTLVGFVAATGNDDVCSCALSATEFPGLGITSFDVEHLPGECRKDKVKNAIEIIVEDVYYLDHYKDEFKACRHDIRHLVLDARYDYIRQLLYEKIDECTVNIDCKIDEYIQKLEKKKCALEDELSTIMGSGAKLANELKERAEKTRK